MEIKEFMYVEVVCTERWELIKIVFLTSCHVFVHNK